MRNFISAMMTMIVMCLLVGNPAAEKNSSGNWGGHDGSGLRRLDTHYWKGDRAPDDWDALPMVPFKKGLDSGTAPGSMDWSSKYKQSVLGGVWGPKQRNCGSCWAFAAIGALEGAWAIDGNDYQEFNIQQLVSCGVPGSDCYGGSAAEALAWIQKNGVCPGQLAYTYTATSGKCSSVEDADCDNDEKVFIKHFTRVSTEDDLKNAVSQQPVAVSIYVDPIMKMRNPTGVLHGFKCKGEPNHAVVVVGYGTEGGLHYWKIRNSWGNGWGEQGFFRLIRGKNQCGITDRAIYPNHLHKKKCNWWGHCWEAKWALRHDKPSRGEHQEEPQFLSGTVMITMVLMTMLAAAACRLSRQHWKAKKTEAVLVKDVPDEGIADQLFEGGLSQ